MKSIAFSALAMVAILAFSPTYTRALPGAGLKPPPFAEIVTDIQSSFEPATARRGQTVLWRVSMLIMPGWHTYPTVQIDPEAKPYVNALKFPPAGEAVFVGDLKEPVFQSRPMPSLHVKELHVVENVATWERSVVISPNATPGKKVIPVSIEITVCDESGCLPPRPVKLETTITITDDPPLEVEAKYKDALKPGLPVKPVSPPEGTGLKPDDGPRNATPNSASETDAGDTKMVTAPVRAVTSEEYAQQLAEVRGSLIPVQTEAESLMGFILAGIFWGAVSLVTPCVFPMIPITVSYFLKQSEKTHHRPITMALVYCGTIIVVLAAAAVLLLSTFRSLSINPWMNIGMGCLFVVFALSLFGMYDIELPSGLAQYTSSREGKGGLLGTMFMALTFTILSFACVAPFLGGFAGTATTQQLGWLGQTLGALAFAATFAAPFFFLALFPSLLKKMPKSGSWLNSVKVVMGFVEIAAALKFFRLGELVLRPEGASFFTYDFVLGIWVALCLLAGLYLLNFYRLPHDTPSDHIGAMRLMFSLAFLGLGFYFVPALFKTNGAENQRPQGVIYAWVDSFLLPEPHASTGTLAWSGNLKESIDEARARFKRTGQRKLLFVDFTGRSCTNCRINENSVFSKPEFRKLLGAYSLVQLYTDIVPSEFYASTIREKLSKDSDRQKEDAHLNLDFQSEAFGTSQLPLYAILEPLPDGKVKVVGTYDEGKINDEGAFAKFLKTPLDSSGPGMQARASLP